MLSLARRGEGNQTAPFEAKALGPGVRRDERIL